jgi:hypothetical protein
MQNSKTLHFETYEETAEWLNTHDMAEYGDQLTPLVSCRFLMPANYARLSSATNVSKFL